MEQAALSMDLERIRTTFKDLRESGIAADLLRLSVEDALHKKAFEITQLDETMQESKLRQLLSLAFQIAKDDICAKVTTVVVVQDVFDVASVKQCERLFCVVEDNISQWKTPFFYEACRNNILRTCNDLLKRLSRTVNTSFCGRILVLLARALPLCEKSGLNLTSQFNTDNIIKYELADTGSKTEGNESIGDDDEDMETGEIKEKETQETPIDFALYAKFWELQSFFSSPLSCYDKTKWKTFQNNTSDVLYALSSRKLDCMIDEDKNIAEKRRKMEDCHSASFYDDDALMASTSLNSASSALVDDIDMRKDHFFAKYLTSQKLLQLQLNDSQFRRYFLVQCLILYQYLVADVKFKDKSCTLNDEQVRFVVESTEKCYRLLAETHPRGAYFASCVKHILEREKEWSDWKNKGCPDYTQLADKDRISVFRKRPRTKYDPTKVDLGNAELTKLWNINPDMLSACEDPQRKFTPAVVDFIRDPLDELDPEQQVEDKYKSINNDSFQWRCSRLFISEGCPYFQVPVKKNEVTVELGPFLEEAIKQTALSISELKDSVPGTNEKKVADVAVNGAVASTAENGKERAGSSEPSTLSVSDSQINDLAPLLAKKLDKLAAALGITAESNDQQSTAESSKIVRKLLMKWRQKEGAEASAKKLSGTLLEADLYTEQVGNVLWNSTKRNSAQ